MTVYDRFVHATSTANGAIGYQYWLSADGIFYLMMIAKESYRICFGNIIINYTNHQSV